MTPWKGLPLIEEESEDTNNNDSDSSRTWDAPDSFNPINVRFLLLTSLSEYFLESNRITIIYINAKYNQSN